MAAILFGFPMVLDKMAAILYKLECHWKTEQMATIGILNVLSFPAPLYLTYATTNNWQKMYESMFDWITCLLALVCLRLPRIIFWCKVLLLGQWRALLLLLLLLLQLLQGHESLLLFGTRVLSLNWFWMWRVNNVSFPTAISWLGSLGRTVNYPWLLLFFGIILNPSVIFILVGKCNFLFLEAFARLRVVAGQARIWSGGR